MSVFNSAISVGSYSSQSGNKSSGSSGSGGSDSGDNGGSLFTSYSNYQPQDSSQGEGNPYSSVGQLKSSFDATSGGFKLSA